MRMRSTRWMLAVLLLGAVAGWGQSAANSEVTAQIASGLFLAKDRDLSFGSMFAPAAPGSVTVAPAVAGATTSSGVTMLTSGNSAQFTAATTGFGWFFWLRLPADNTIQLSNGSGGSMQIRNFTTNVAPQCVSKSATRPGGPFFTCPGVLNIFITQTFWVGGTLDVGANQPTGVYSGTFPVTITYF